MGSLILTRKISEKIIIDSNIIIRICGIKGNQVSLAIDALEDVEIWRQEIFDKIQQEKGS